MRFFWLILFCALKTLADVTPSEYLALQAKPQFKPGTRLPRLTWAGWPLPESLKIEIATNWGYTLDLDDANLGTVQAITNASTETYRLAQLARQYPDKFKISCSVSRYFQNTMANFPTVSGGFYCTNAAGQWVNNSATTYTDFNAYSPQVISPEAPAADLELLTERQASFLRIINSNVPISVVLNAGEYGLGVPGGDQTAWLKDPRVQAATNGFTLYRYASNRKAYQLGFLTSKINSYLPDRSLYIFYNTGLEQTRYNQPGYTWVQEWGWDSDVMNTNTDLPSFENYYILDYSYTNATGTTWNNVTDLLTRQLDAVGYNHTLGYSNNYSWLSGGYSLSNTNRLSPINRYIGFLKCLYMSGMVGGIAGYYEFPTGTNASIFGSYGFEGSFPTNLPPHWLLQIEATARVHAQFSWLDDWLYNSDLLSGPQKHFISQDQPAYEFTNTVGDATVRVLARKQRTSNQLLICAWAAAGANRNVTVNIPTLGNVTVTAAPEGSIYTGDTNGLMLDGRVGVETASIGTIYLR